MKPLIVIFLQFAMLIFLHGQQKATTETGETVILNADGTWVLESEPVEPTTDEKPNFRNAYWGDSLDTVKKGEDSKLAQESEDVLAYEDFVAGIHVMAVYFFEENKLTTAYYTMTDTHTNANDYIDDYTKFKKILTDKYGTPPYDKTVWKNDLYKDDYEDWGTAIKLGHLLFLAGWELDDTSIMITLRGENYKAGVSILYKSKELDYLEKRSDEKENQDKF